MNDNSLQHSYLSTPKSMARQPFTSREFNQREGLATRETNGTQY